ncbi:hypothetical protein [Spirosoma utsteinense]|uniref:hypothetical protein n=1 Tax=Spirosoma utsteinense TaxID=2585773 RepID=UPI0016454DAE|nr:hypothetical protein [Spirosoma utsteinense]MBC3785716.1 hypothetical protein [Spirosoma utsteinense]
MDFSPYLGLVREPALPCFGEPPEQAQNAPATAITYLSDVPELSLSRVVSVDPYAALSQARAAASQDLNADLKAFLSAGFPSRPLYSGLLGNSSYTQFPASQLSAGVLPLTMQFQQGGEFIIRLLGMILSESVADLPVGLYRQGEEEPIKSMTINVLARSATMYTLAEAWRIPLDGNRYEIRAALPDGVKVADNNLSCGCSNQVGALGAILANCCAGKASGFVLTLGSNCNYDPLLIQLVENDRTRLVIGYMLAYRAAYRLAAAPPSGTIDRSSVLSESDLSDAAARCEQEYLNRLGWLKNEVSKMNLSTESTCFQPKRVGGWSRSGLMR